jgi:hypothetical protein
MTQVYLPNRKSQNGELDNLDAILRVLNGDIADDNVAEKANLRVAKLAPGPEGQGVITVGGKVQWGAVGGAIGPPTLTPSIDKLLLATTN